MSGIDLLMITHRRAEYTAQSLPALLDAGDESTRVWVWHNGDDRATLDVIDAYRDHPRLHRFHHSPENQLVRAPTNWLFREATGSYLGVVADDCVVHPGWAQKLRRMHEDEPSFGVLACWHWRQEDFDEPLAVRKIRAFRGGHRLLVHPWTQGSGVLIKRRCIEQIGLLPEKDKGFTHHCVRLARRGWINGWAVPIIPIDHLDDPRFAQSMLRSDAALLEHLPLSAKLRGVKTVAQWADHLTRSARAMQIAPSDPGAYVGWRSRLRRLGLRLTGGDLTYGREPAAA